MDTRQNKEAASNPENRELAASRLRDLNIDLSFSSILSIFRESLNYIIGSFFVLLCLSTIYVLTASKQYEASGVVEQPDLSGNLQSVDASGFSLSKSLLNQNDNDRIGKYIVMISSPNVAQSVMDDDGLMKVLFGEKWVREPGSKYWVRKFGPGYIADQIRCWLFDETCPRHLSPERVSDEISSKLGIAATVMPNQGLLGNNSTSYSITLVGPDPKELLRLLRALHEGTNRMIQAHEVAIARQLLASMDRRVGTIQNNDAKQAMIQILAAQERQVAVMTASKIDYAADWVLEPTVSAWPVKPNISLILGMDIVLSLAIGIFISQGGMGRLLRRRSRV